MYRSNCQIPSYIIHPIFQFIPSFLDARRIESSTPILNSPLDLTFFLTDMRASQTVDYSNNYKVNMNDT
jgi:hypothetical protein